MHVEEKSEINDNVDNETEINELNDFFSAISGIRNAILREEGEDTDAKHFFFRGQACKDWDIIPGIFRNNMLAHESELIRSAYVRNPEDFKSLNSNFERLTKLQHYGLPTRLLDVTQNPLVALYFACQDHTEIIEENGIKELKQKDGAVYYQRSYCKGYDDLEIRVISYLANKEIQGDLNLKQLLSELVENQIYTEKAAKECEARKYKSLIDILQNNYYVLSNMNNERLIRQSGAFIICGDYNIIPKSEASDNWLIQPANGSIANEFVKERFIVPAEAKERLLEELNFYNINEGALFPELEHQMTHIKNTQTNKSVKSVGVFAKMPEDFQEHKVMPIYEIPEDKMNEIVTNSIHSSGINKSLYEDCLVTIYDNATIDWYQKDQSKSKMRVELTNMLINTAKIDRTIAKNTAGKIVDGILSQINNYIKDQLIPV